MVFRYCCVLAAIASRVRVILTLSSGVALPIARAFSYSPCASFNLASLMSAKPLKV